MKERHCANCGKTFLSAIHYAPTFCGWECWEKYCGKQYADAVLGMLRGLKL